MSEPRFGVSLLVDPGADPVGGARHAEELGFDLVTVTDHLEGRRPSLETWTLLAWVAARTERVAVAPNVLSLPYRPPPVVAKMAESLDRLSGGRLILPLGAGGPDDKFQAFGLEDRSPGEKVEALEEAIDVIRGLWREPDLSFPGKHVRVSGATIEPRPERDIPIWVGAYGPRMLRLIGRKADGWLPSLVYLPPEPAFRKMEEVRAAAEGAGRDPDALDYAYNVWVLVKEGATAREGQVAGGPEEVAGTLVSLLRGGFTVLNFWMSGDPAEQRERLAKEVLPEVRRLLD